MADRAVGAGSAGLAAAVAATWGRADLVAAAAFGVVLASMNVFFYLALAHLPLGTAVAIEFLGPVAVAAIGGRGWRDRVGIAGRGRRAPRWPASV